GVFWHTMIDPPATACPMAEISPERRARHDEGLSVWSALRESRDDNSSYASQEPLVTVGGKWYGGCVPLPPSCGGCVPQPSLPGWRGRRNPLGIEGCGNRALMPILVYEYLRTSPRKRRLGYEEMRDGAVSDHGAAEGGAAEDQQPARAVA